MAEDAVALHTRQVPQVAGGAGERLAGDLAQTTASTRTEVTEAATPTHVVTLVYNGWAVGAAGSFHRWGEEVRTAVINSPRYGAKGKFKYAGDLPQIRKAQWSETGASIQSCKGSTRLCQ